MCGHTYTPENKDVGIGRHEGITVDLSHTQDKFSKQHNQITLKKNTVYETRERYRGVMFRNFGYRSFRSDVQEKIVRAVLNKQDVLGTYATHFKISHIIDTCVIMWYLLCFKELCQLDLENLSGQRIENFLNF